MVVNANKLAINHSACQEAHVSKGTRGEGKRRSGAESICHSQIAAFTAAALLSERVLQQS